VAPPLARLRRVGLQQDARSGQQLRRALARAHQSLESLALLGAQLHHVLLDRNLFPDHESPPSPTAATEIQKNTTDSMTPATRASPKRNATLLQQAVKQADSA